MTDLFHQEKWLRRLYYAQCLVIGVALGKLLA